MTYFEQIFAQYFNDKIVDYFLKSLLHFCRKSILKMNLSIETFFYSLKISFIILLKKQLSSKECNYGTLERTSQGYWPSKLRGQLSRNNYILKSKKQKAKKKRKEWLVVLNPHLENFNIGFYSLWFICFWIIGILSKRFFRQKTTFSVIFIVYVFPHFRRS